MRGSTPRKLQKHLKTSQKPSKNTQNYLYIYIYVSIFLWTRPTASSGRGLDARRRALGIIRDVVVAWDTYGAALSTSWGRPMA